MAPFLLSLYIDYILPTWADNSQRNIVTIDAADNDVPRGLEVGAGNTRFSGKLVGNVLAV